AVIRLLPDRILAGPGRIRGITVVPIIAIIRPGSARIGRASTRPRQIERIPLRSSLRIFNANYRNPAISRIADQRLPAASVNSGESEVGRIHGHSSRALEPAPLRRLAGEIPQNGIVASHFNLCYSVDHNFNGALTLIVITAPY